ncbi:MAG: uracil phosphoribosyltransferase [Simkaniaceae bacterium]
MIKEALAKLRDLNTSPSEFRYYSQLIFKHMAKEALNGLEAEKIYLIILLRSGIAMLPSFLHIFPTAKIGFFGVERDEHTAIPRKYYENIPKFSVPDHIFLLDPMIATGGTMTMAVDRLKELGAGEGQMQIFSLISAKPGIETLKKRFPLIKMHLHVQDPGLDKDNWISPGLGDFGNRFFDTFQA